MFYNLIVISITYTTILLGHPIRNLFCNILNSYLTFVMIISLPELHFLILIRTVTAVAWLLGTKSVL